MSVDTDGSCNGVFLDLASGESMYVGDFVSYFYF